MKDMTKGSSSPSTYLNETDNNQDETNEIEIVNDSCDQTPRSLLKSDLKDRSSESEETKQH